MTSLVTLPEATVRVQSSSKQFQDFPSGKSLTVTDKLYIIEGVSNTYLNDVLNFASEHDYTGIQIREADVPLFFSSENAHDIFKQLSDHPRDACLDMLQAIEEIAFSADEDLNSSLFRGELTANNGGKWSFEYLLWREKHNLSFHLLEAAPKTKQKISASAKINKILDFQDKYEKELEAIKKQKYMMQAKRDALAKMRALKEEKWL